MKKLFRTFPWAGVLLWMLLAGVFCWSASPLGLSILSASIGAVSGGVTAYLAQNRRLHLGRIWLVVLSLMWVTHLITDFVRWWSPPSLLLAVPRSTF